MLLTDNDFLRLERNYVTLYAAPSQEHLQRKSLCESLFMKPLPLSDPSSTTSSTAGSTEPMEGRRRCFVKPTPTSGFRMTSVAPCLRFPRIILRVSPKCPLKDLLGYRVLPNELSFISTAPKPSESEAPDTSSTIFPSALASNAASTPPSRKHVGSQSNIRAQSTTFGTSKHEENCVIRQIRFSDSATSVNLSTIKSVHNADWTCDGKFVVVCGKQGFLLGDVSLASFVTSSTGEYSRVACHPIFPTVFAALLSSSSLIIYEINERPNGKPGHSGYVMKITAEMKFTSVRLSNAVLAWSPTGNMLVISNHDRGFYLLAFEEVTPSGGSTTSTVDTSVSTGFPQVPSRPQRPRRALRIIGQGKFESRISGATFRCIYQHGHYDAVEASLNPFFEKEIAAQQKVLSLFLYVSLENGQLWACVIDLNSAHSSDLRSSPYKNLTQNARRIHVGLEVTCMDTDPFCGRFIALGGADDSLHILDGPSDLMVGVHHRIGAPMGHIAVSAGGLLVAWAPQPLALSDSRPNDWQDASRSPPNRSYMGISCIGRGGLEFLWKMDLPANITCLRWHPWLPALLVLYDSNARLTHGHHPSLTSSTGGDSYNSGQSQAPCSSVLIVHFK